MKRILIGTLITAAMIVPGARAVSARQERPAPTVAYVVQPGDTLWMIAGTVDNDADPREVVDRVMDLNELTSATLVPGQRLLLPA